MTEDWVKPRLRALVIAAPIAAALVWIVGINLIQVVWHLTRPWPVDPWEAGQTMEAWRSSQGLPVYEDPETGHATHMYGALAPYVVGLTFRITGPNNYAGKLVSLLSGLVLITVLARALTRGQAPWYFLIAVVLFFGTNFRAINFFVWNRPDLPALLLATVALILFYRGLVTGRRWLYGLGVGLVIAAFFFKQPAVMVAAIPGLALLFPSPVSRRERWLLALIPLAAIACTLLILRHFFPMVYFYMVENPAVHTIFLNKLVRRIWELLLETPLFLLLLAHALMTGRGWPRTARDPGAWVLAALMVTIPASGVTVAKAGGGDNSLLPALLALMAFCVLRLESFLPRLFDPRLPLLRRFALSTMVAVVMVMSVFPIFVLNARYYPTPELRAGAYLRAIAEVRTLPGKVLCPEDPTIPMMAKGTPGRSIYLEYDSAIEGDWAAPPPSYVVAHIASADYVVDVHEFSHDLVTAELLRELGFEPAYERRYYSLWQQKRSSSSSSPSS